MTQSTPVTEIRRPRASDRSQLDELVRQGARQMPLSALEAEMEDYVRRQEGALARTKAEPLSPDHSGT